MLHAHLGTVPVTAGVSPALQDMCWVRTAYVTLHAGIRIIIVPLVPAVMESVVPWEIVATADAYRALRDLYWDLTACVTQLAGILTITVQLVSAAMDVV